MRQQVNIGSRPSLGTSYGSQIRGRIKGRLNLNKLLIKGPS
jgi:hypothetical protein